MEKLGLTNKLKGINISGGTDEILGINKLKSENIKMLPISKICMTKNHPFRLYKGERLNDMVESIKLFGVLTPTIVRNIEPDENGCEYEMLAGNNRMNASRIAGENELPCIVKENLSDKDAMTYIIVTNLLQRSFSEMLPSEKAAVLYLEHSEMFSQGKRNDIFNELKKLENPEYNIEDATYGHDVHKLSRDFVGSEYGLDGRSVARYLRVHELIDELKVRLDDGEIALVASVELSYLLEQEQQMVEELLKNKKCKVNHKKAKILRKSKGRLDDKLVAEIILDEVINNQDVNKSKPIKIRHTVISKYFTAGETKEEIEDIIEIALEDYFNKTN